MVEYMNDFSIKHCARCKAYIKIPFLTAEQKKEVETVREKQGMGSILARIREITRFDLMDSKMLAIHINESGRCNRCNYDELEGENQTCPKCKSFNLN